MLKYFHSDRLSTLAPNKMYNKFFKYLLLIFSWIQHAYTYGDILKSFLKKIRDTFWILSDPKPQPRCDICDMFFLNLFLVLYH